jgi:hypothetical protein
MKSYIFLFFCLFIFNSIQSQELVIKKAIIMQSKYAVKSSKYVVLIDYSKSIFSKRLFVVDVKAEKIILTSTVSHAFKSGLQYATKFSNKEGTLMSCIGAFETSSTYYGQFGYSLILKGLDKGINSNAEQRKIIFHSSKKMKTKWSWGCFATPEEINIKLIDLIKNGCLVYVYK